MALFALPAFAGDVSYNYVELGYQKIDVDDLGIGADADGDGFAIGGSFEISESWFVAASYSQAELDLPVGFGVSLDLDQMSLGVGWHTAISDNSDFYAQLDYVSAEVSLSGFGSADEDGYGATIGLRSMVTNNVELGGSIGYVDLGDAGDGTAFGAHALYSFTDNFAVGLLLGFEEDITTYGAGIRFYW